MAVGLDDERGDRESASPAAGISRPSTSRITLEHDRPPLEEQRVENLVLGGEVVVDEPVGDARLVGDVGDAAGVEAAGGRTSARPRRGSAAACRPPPGCAFVDHQRSRRPGVGRRPAVGERRELGADPLERGSRSSVARRRRPCRAPGRGPRPTDRRSSTARPSGRPGGWRPIWLAATTNAWFSIARARSSVSQWSRVVASVKAAGTSRIASPAQREDPVELGEADVVADAQTELGAAGRPRGDDLAPRRRSCSDSW